MAIAKQEELFEIDPILDYIGPKGKWQYFHGLCMFLSAASAGLTVVSFAFPGFVPKYRCQISMCEITKPPVYNLNQSLLNKVVFPRTCNIIIPFTIMHMSILKLISIFRKNV